MLPEAISNNAVAALDGIDGAMLYSFNGLKSGKSWKDVSNIAYACSVAKSECETIAGIPGGEGRLASAAVTVGDKIYILGGYSVAENEDEVTSPQVHSYDPATQTYKRLSDMPTPVDDAVVAAYKDRYIYVISGWQNEANVSVVQIYDTQSDSWSDATPFPGKPVFGHAGGIANKSIIVTDGVAVAGLVDGKRKFAAAPFAWRGDIDPGDPARITWRGIKSHYGGPLYRMAATGDNASGQVIFAGGGDNPYNYDGMGYDGVAAKPSQRIFAYDLSSDKWIEKGQLAAATMDHRGLAKSGKAYYIMGGMDDKQLPTRQIMRFRLKDEK